MGLFNKKKADPISERAQVLNAQIAALEAQIALLNAQQANAAHTQKHPRLRSTTIPHGPTAAPPAAIAEPVFEELDHGRLAEPPEPTSDQYHDLGVRKYDLSAAWRRLLKQFRGPPSSNPKLVNYLAAGSIQGLRPLRYEKRVARNRFLFLMICLGLLLLGVITAFVRH